MLHSFCALKGVLVLLVAWWVAAPSAAGQQAPQSYWVYVGTYTGPKSQGIYLFKLDLASGALVPQGLAGAVVNPTFLAIHPNQRYLYCVSEIGNLNGKPTGGVSAFAIDPASGKLTLLNQQPSGGRGPCHVSVDPAGKNVLVANYGGGSVAVLPIRSDGSLAEASAFVQHQGKGPNPRRQEGPHAHSIKLDPTGRFALAADLGTDQLMIYRFDPAKGTLQPNNPAAHRFEGGAGPRHFTFHPKGQTAYVINELSNTISVLGYNADRGLFRALQSLSTLPEGFKGQNTTAEVVVHPSGRFLYGSNRGHDSIAMFAIDPTTDQLTALGQESTQGKQPRNFNIDPTGTYLLAANQGSDSVVVFRIDAQSGKLQATGTKVEAPSPVCVTFLAIPAGK